MAAAIAAACEYGRRQGHPESFEVLRRLPSELGQQAKGHPEKTVMLSLFQAAESGRRLFELFTDALNEHYNRCPRRKWFGKHRVVFKYVFQIYSPSWLFVGALLTSGLLLRIAQLRYGRSGTLEELVPLLKPSGMKALLYVLITSIALVLVVWWILNPSVA